MEYNWIDINKDKPPLYEWVIIHHTFYRVRPVTMGFMHSCGDFETEDDSIEKEHITHWMFPPEPPSAK